MLKFSHFAPLIVMCAALNTPAFSKSEKAVSKKSDQSQTVDVKPRQLAIGLTCEQATEIIGGPRYGQLDAIERREVSIAREQCVVAEHNKAKPSNPEITLLAPSPNDDQKVFFKTIRRKDVRAVGEVCKQIAGEIFKAAQAAGASDPRTAAGIAGLTIVSDRGKVQCNSYIRGLEGDNALVVLAPAGLSGSAVSVRILQLAGLGKPAKEVQDAVDSLGKEVGKVAATTINDIKKNPTILLPNSSGHIARYEYLKQKTGLPLPPSPAAEISRQIPCVLTLKCSGIRCRNTC